MQELKLHEMSQINGGCAKHCWGDVSFSQIVGNAIGGAIAGSRGGVGGAVLGFVGAGVGTLLGQLWN